jgi:hypothetical protein
MTVAVASSMSTATARRLHYQSQITNTSGQNLSNSDASHINESFSFSHTSGNPLITIVYSKGSLSQGILIIEVNTNSM